MHQKWLREKDPIAIKENTFMTGKNSSHLDEFYKFFPNFFKYQFPNIKSAYLAGVRAEESPTRAMALTNNVTYKDITWGKTLNKKAEQGSSVAISADGNTIIVGGNKDDTAIGAAWIYTRVNGVWSQMGPKLVGSNPIGISRQGFSVAISADGNTAIIGGAQDDYDIGAVWVFIRNNGTWVQQGNKLVGTGRAGGHVFQGEHVSTSADGNTIILSGGGDNNNIGAIWFFARSAGVWSQQGNKIVPAGINSSLNYNISASLSANGDLALIGRGSDNSDSGSIWIYKRNSGVWSLIGSKFRSSTAVGKVRQGVSVAISKDGQTIIEGGIFDNNWKGAAWVFGPSCNSQVFNFNTINSCRDSVLVEASPNLVSYLWSNGKTTSSFYAKASGWYKLNWISSLCTGNDSVYVQLVKADILQNDTSLCFGSKINLQALYSTNYKYLWSTGDTTSIINYTATSNAKIWIKVIDGAIMCSDTINISVINKPTISLNSSGNMCSGTTGFLNGLVSGGGSIVQYKIETNGGVVIYSGATPPTFPFSISPIVTTTYVYTIFSSTCGLLSDSVIVKVNPKPQSSFTINNKAQCLNVNNFVFTNTSSISKGNLSYVWNFGNGSSDTSMNTSKVYSLSGSFKISLITKSDSGCIDTSFQTVIVSITPNIIGTNYKSICSGEQVNFALIADSPSTFSWFANSNSNVKGMSINPQSTNIINDTLINLTDSFQTVTYNVIPTSINGKCQGVSKIISIKVFPKPKITFSVSRNNLCEGDSIILMAYGGNTYSWTGPDGFTSNTQNPIISDITVNKFGYYKVVVTDTNGCSDTGRINVMRSSQPCFFIPTIFTPNGDGINDTWEIPGIKDYPNCEVHVFNRWGQLLFSSIGYKSAWDGTNHGEPCPTADYYFIIDLKTGNTALNGSLTIKR